MVDIVVVFVVRLEVVVILDITIHLTMFQKNLLNINLCLKDREMFFMIDRKLEN